MRGRRTAFEDLIIIAGRLPWQAGLVLALLSFAVLHVIVVHFSLPTAARGNVNFGAIYTHTFLATVAKLAQFIVPPALLIGAGTSAWRRSRASALVDGSGLNGTAGAESLSWSEFEQLVAELFRRQGYAVTENLIGGPDGGVDLVLRKGSDHTLVQCKHWRTQRVGASVVRELKGVMAARGISGGFVVSSGTFTDQARAFAAEARIGLVDGPQLMSMRHQFSRSASGQAARSGTIAGFTVGGEGNTSPACPKCGTPMVRRRARRGSNAGGEFWGCKQYPGCRGTLSV
jgi:restriction system protein